MKSLISAALTIFVLGCKSAQQEPVQFRWQVAESPAVYSVVNQEIDIIPELMISGFDVYDEPEMRQRLLQELERIELPVATYEGRVRPHENGVRASLLAVSPEEDRAPQSEKEALHRRMAEQKAGLTELLGDFSEDGKLRSFFLGRRHKAALNLLFSLPSKPLGISDSWSPDVTGLEIGQRFFPSDSRRVRKAVLESLDQDSDGRLVATMFYVVTDEVSGHFEYKQGGDIKNLMMDVSNTYYATGEFLVNSGRWKAFTAVNANTVGGGNSSQRMILYAMRLKE